MLCNPSSIIPPSPSFWRDRTPVAWISSCCRARWLFSLGGEGEGRKSRQAHATEVICFAESRGDGAAHPGLAIQEKSHFPNLAFPTQQQGDSLAPGPSCSVNHSPSFLAGLGKLGGKARCQHTSGTGLKAEEYMLLVPNRTDGWEWKLHRTNSKMDSGVGAVNGQLSGKLSLSRSEAVLEEATFVSHFVLIYLSSSLPRCYDESSLQIIASISFSFMKKQTHTTLVLKGSGVPSSFSDNKLVRMWLKRLVGEKPTNPKTKGKADFHLSLPESSKSDDLLKIKIFFF